MAKRKRSKGRGRKSRSRAVSAKVGIVLSVLAVALGIAGEWFVHHPRQWVAERCETWPGALTAALLKVGNPLADLTDALDLTGHDAVYEYDIAAPAGSVSFAGLPVRKGAPAPGDISIIDRGEFVIGWSASLRHPVWCAYHVTKDAVHFDERRPSFRKDRSCPSAPTPDEYRHSGFDRGHMAPNYAILTRYGEEARLKTFFMSNIAPQSPALNRGVWRDMEHRIASLWTAAYGEIWVVVGCFTPTDGSIAHIGNTGIDIPQQFYQVVIAQDGLNVRALATIFPQSIGWDAWAARGLISIDELEQLTGLDFNPELPEFIQDPLEAELPSRLWPIRKQDVFRLISLRFSAQDPAGREANR